MRSHWAKCFGFMKGSARPLDLPDVAGLHLVALSYHPTAIKFNFFFSQQNVPFSTATNNHHHDHLAAKICAHPLTAILPPPPHTHARNLHYFLPSVLLLFPVDCVRFLYTLLLFNNFSVGFSIFLRIDCQTFGKLLSCHLRPSILQTGKSKNVCV